MPLKKQRKNSGRGRTKKTLAPTRSASSLSPKQTDDNGNNQHSDNDDQNRPRSDSNASSVASVNETVVSVAPSDSNSSQTQNDRQKRARKTPYSLTDEEEKSMLEFLQDNPMLWDIKMTDFRRTDKKNKLWEDQAALLGKTADYLRGWFKSLRDNFTRLDKKKSGDGAPDLTEREQWVKENFSFLKVATRHRPEPVNSVKAAIDAYPGNLDAAEAACEELAGTDDVDSINSRSTSTIRRDKKGHEEDILMSLQKSVRQSGELLKTLSVPQPQPISGNTAFANYVRDSLLTMNKRKFKKVRSAINKVLTEAMDEDSEDEGENPVRTALPPNTFPQVRPVMTTTYLNPSPSDMYQPPPNMWRHKPPQASVWSSATQDYVDQYMQQPMQPQQPSPLQQEQSMMQPGQQQQQQSSGSLSAILGPVSQVLNPSPNLSDF